MIENKRKSCHWPFLGALSVIGSAALLAHQDNIAEEGEETLFSLRAFNDKVSHLTGNNEVFATCYNW